MDVTDISPSLDRITLRMTSNLELEEVLHAVTDGLAEDLGASGAYIWLAGDRPEGTPEFAEAPGPRLVSSAGLALDAATPVPRKIDWILEHRDHFCTNSLPTDGSIGPAAWLLENGLRAVGGFPLLFGDELMGAMAVFFRRSIRQEIFERLFLFARQAAVAIRTARLFAEVERLSERLRAENRYLHEDAELELGLNCGEIVGRSPAIRQVLEQVEQVAPADSTVLIQGETGTGKELIARAIHQRSRRHDAALVKVNCGAISAGLVESELFGHERGAFTGALERRIGRFELADGGTLFLDEVGELPAETQVKLLRALQEREFERVGSSQPVQIDVRVIAATNRNLAEEVRAGRFRSDLFYRLNVFPLTVPPLRERDDDAVLIASCALGHLGKRTGRRFTGLTDTARERLLRYGWPGNVRELLNVIERAAILSKGPLLEIDASLGEGIMVPSSIAAESPGVETPKEDAPKEDAGPLAPLAEVERRYIERVLEATSGVIEGPRGAAGILGLHPNTLRSRMDRLGVRRPAR